MLPPICSSTHDIALTKKRKNIRSRSGNRENSIIFHSRRIYLKSRDAGGNDNHSHSQKSSLPQSSIDRLRPPPLMQTRFQARRHRHRSQLTGGCLQKLHNIAPKMNEEFLRRKETITKRIQAMKALGNPMGISSCNDASKDIGRKEVDKLDVNDAAKLVPPTSPKILGYRRINDNDMEKDSNKERRRSSIFKQQFRDRRRSSIMLSQINGSNSNKSLESEDFDSLEEDGTYTGMFSFLDSWTGKV